VKKIKIADEASLEVVASVEEERSLAWLRWVLPESLAWWHVSAIFAVLFIGCTLVGSPPPRRIGPEPLSYLLLIPGVLFVYATPVLFLVDLFGFPRIPLAPVQALPPPE
jgi:hypothetical protein